MQLLQHFKDLTLHPKNAQELKGLILQLAIQGKLTANWRQDNPNIEPASELLKTINKNKELLIKTKKARKETAKREFLKVNVSFTIPNTWLSRNITEFYYTVGSRSNQIQSKNYSEIGKYPIVSQGKNRIDGYSDDGSKLLEITKPVIVFGDHTRLVKFIDFNFIIGADGTKILNPFDGVESEYFYLHMSYYDLSSKGYARHYSLLKLEAFALPPLEEQQEIVKIVETLFKEVEQLEQLTVERISLKEDFVTSALNQLTTNNAKNEWAFLQDHFTSFFNKTSNIKKLRETVLQLAVQGKLTAVWRANNPEKEDASILLKRIQKEKAQLIKDNKIKKEKPLPPITKDEVPYELPAGWVWCRMGMLSDIQRGSSPRPKGDARYFSETRTKNHWISIKDISMFTINNILLNTGEYLTDLGTKYSRYVDKNELIVAVSGSTTGKCCLTGIEGFIYDGLAVIKLFKNSINTEFLLLYMLQLYNHMNDSKFGAAFPNINTKFLNEMLFPFPPLKEQQAIVQKVNALMGLCDELEQEVLQSQGQIEKLMQSCLREVFEEKKEELAV